MPVVFADLKSLVLGVAVEAENLHFLKTKLRTIVTMDRNRLPSPLYADVKLLHFLPGPGSSPKKCETGLDAGIKLKTSYVYDTAEVLPSKMFDELRQDHLKRLSMKWIFGWHGIHHQNKANLGIHHNFIPPMLRTF